MPLNPGASEFKPSFMTPISNALPTVPPAPPVTASGDIDWFNVGFVNALTSPPTAQEDGHRETEIQTSATQTNASHSEESTGTSDHPHLAHESPYNTTQYGEEYHDGVEWEGEDSSSWLQGEDYGEAMYSGQEGDEGGNDPAATLASLGFSEESVNHALAICCGDIFAAFDFLLAQSSSSLQSTQESHGAQSASSIANGPEPIEFSVPMSLTEQLRLKKLEEEFSWIPSYEVAARFHQQGRSLTHTQNSLKAEFPRPAHVPAPSNTPQIASKAHRLFAQHAKHAKHSQPVGDGEGIAWVATGDAVNSLYEELRGEAIVHAQIRNDLFDKAVVAYRAGDKLLAKTLGRQGREHNASMHRLHAAAREAIISARNPEHNQQSAARTLDLHGLHISESVNLVQAEVQKLKGSTSGVARVVYVITGTGHHAFDGRARVGPAVQEFLEKEDGIIFTETQPGMLAVRVL